MPPIVLPTNPGPQSAEPYFVDMGGWQAPEFGGGDAIRLDRLGDRFGLSVLMPPMFFDDPARGIHARQWISRLNRGSSVGVRFEFPQPGFTPPITGGNVAVAAAAQSSALIINSAAGVTLVEGTFVTVVDVSTGRRFLHHLQFDITASAGQLYLSLWPRLRFAAVIGDQVIFTPPSIDGMLIGDRRGWSLDMARTVGIQFDIVEIG